MDIAREACPNFDLIKTEGLSQDKGSGHIFISHVEEDSTIALQVAGALEAKGYSTWYYERDSVPGSAYQAQMGDAIEQAQAVVLLDAQVMHYSDLDSSMPSLIRRNPTG